MTIELTLLTWVSFRDQEITAPRLRGLLALLAGELRAGCSTALLVDGLWPDERPENPTKALQIFVSRARARLGADVIASTPTGYGLALSDDQVDSSAVLLCTAAGAERSRAVGLQRGFTAVSGGTRRVNHRTSSCRGPRRLIVYRERSRRSPVGRGIRCRYEGEDGRGVAPVAGQDVRGTLPEGLGDAIRGTAEDIAALLREVGDTSVPVPGSEWSVGAAAAHLARANELMADIAAGHERAHGDGTAQSLAAANERALAEFDEREAGPLAEMIVAQAAAFLTAADRTAADERSAEGTLATPLGPMSQAELGSYLLTHMLGHGYDLARALGRPHMIDRTRVELSLPFLITVMPRVVATENSAGLTARYTIRLWGGARFGVTFTDGAVTVSPQPPSRPDCTILTEPVTFLLMGLGRCEPWGAMAKGRVVTWGRKPWLAPRFPTLFTAP